MARDDDEHARSKSLQGGHRPLDLGPGNGCVANDDDQPARPQRDDLSPGNHLGQPTCGDRPAVLLEQPPVDRTVEVVGCRQHALSARTCRAGQVVGEIGHDLLQLPEPPGPGPTGTTFASMKTMPVRARMARIADWRRAPAWRHIERYVRLQPPGARRVKAVPRRTLSLARAESFAAATFPASSMTSSSSGSVSLSAAQNESSTSEWWPSVSTGDADSRPPSARAADSTSGRWPAS